MAVSPPGLPKRSCRCPMGCIQNPTNCTNVPNAGVKNASADMDILEPNLGHRMAAKHNESFVDVEGLGPGKVGLLMHADSPC